MWWVFVCYSPKYPSQWKTMKTPENPESPCCLGPVFIGIPPPRSPSPPPPTPQTTHCSGGKACSGHDGWAGKGVAVPVPQRGVRGVRPRGSASRDWPCSGAQRGKNSMPWCGQEWNTWAFLQLDSVSLLELCVQFIYNGTVVGGCWSLSRLTLGDGRVHRGPVHHRAYMGRQSTTHTFTPRANLETPGSLISNAWLWTVRGSQSTGENPRDHSENMQTAQEMFPCIKVLLIKCYFKHLYPDFEALDIW